MKRTIRSALWDMEFRPLLSLVNDLTAENWRQVLKLFDEHQLFKIFGWDVDADRRPQRIDGTPATYASAESLRRDIRNRLAVIAISRQEEPRHWVWRPALVLPTREIFFEDAGEGFRFLAERLECEVGERGSQKLHLGQCLCGCEKFFLWEGNWQRKKRLFLDDGHRMRYHNKRNVENKRQFAKKQRDAGDERYF
ncbi:MAG: hypothetical protein ACRD4X_13085 [Candidatus Acidiferrales bacterium]